MEINKGEAMSLEHKDGPLLDAGDVYRSELVEIARAKIRAYRAALAATERAIDANIKALEDEIAFVLAHDTGPPRELAPKLRHVDALKKAREQK